MNKITKSSKQNQKKVKIDRIVLAIPESSIKDIAKEHLGYELSDDELVEISASLECGQVAGEVIHDAIVLALHFIANPAKCNWELVNPKFREESRLEFATSKEHFKDVLCEYHELCFKQFGKIVNN